MAPNLRIALVQLSPYGKSYVASCEREDLVSGDTVEILMHANSKKQCYMQGVITSIQYQRWSCSCHVLNHIDEVDYKFLPDGSFERTVIQK
mgnify:CR=1 FL=1